MTLLITAGAARGVPDGLQIVPAGNVPPLLDPELLPLPLLEPELLPLPLLDPELLPLPLLELDPELLPLPLLVLDPEPEPLPLDPELPLLDAEPASALELLSVPPSRVETLPELLHATYAPRTKTPTKGPPTESARYDMDGLQRVRTAPSYGVHPRGERKYALATASPRLPHRSVDVFGLTLGQPLRSRATLGPRAASRGEA